MTCDLSCYDSVLNRYDTPLSYHDWRYDILKQLQMKSERDDDKLTAERLRIEELEALAASRQKKVTEKAQLHSTDVKNKDQEVMNLKKQLTEFVVERKGWLEEIDRKQAELVAEQIALEKLRQHDRLLTTKNVMLVVIEPYVLQHILTCKDCLVLMENVNHKKKLMELIIIKVHMKKL
ncbi:hypothetical protein POM88_023270 [Heracleum sosnowskyi]|uniref:Uncharacterized protein n=1 Tax=Heracleum sosnowskyi TaxID=360622 RepID=A0AAD8IGZ8_9APIA|nr:hypothetical protein POM88_023270 [Heracleum sosnowskyi]